MTATPINTYDQGALVHLVASFTVGGVATDPATVAVTLRKADGTTATPTALKAAVGTWYVDVDTTGGPAGVWSYKFAGTGAAQAVADSAFYVRNPGF